MATKIEHRIFQFTQEVRAAGDSPAMQGYAAVFNTPTSIGGWFTEIIAPGAFARAIAEKQDVRALFNHDPNFVLGRTKNGTLVLAEDNTGLQINCQFPDTQQAADVRALIARGDVDQMSFGFVVTQENVTYDDDGNCTRTIMDLNLFDVSAVTYPAYPSTSVQARSMDEIADSFKREQPKKEIVPEVNSSVLDNAKRKTYLAEIELM